MKLNKLFMPFAFAALVFAMVPSHQEAKADMVTTTFASVPATVSYWNGFALPLAQPTYFVDYTPVTSTYQYTVPVQSTYMQPVLNYAPGFTYATPVGFSYLY